MNFKLALSVVSGLACACSTGWAQTAPASAATSAAPVAHARPSIVVDSDEQVERSEPNVRHILVEDQGSKIEELRVRGQTQHIIVTPKVGTTKSYEILVAPGGRDMTDGTGGPRNTTGKRVWSVLNF
jgi:hypothetical protein